MHEEVPQFDGKVDLMCVCNIDNKQKAGVIYKHRGMCSSIHINHNKLY